MRPGLRIVDRYLISEVFPPFLLSFSAYTFLLLLRSLLEIAERVIRHDLPAAEILALLGWSLPHIVVLTIPIGFLVGILVGVGRVSSESEMIALRSAGISYRRIVLAILPLAIGIFLLDVWLMTVALPTGNQRLQEAFLRMDASVVAGKVTARRFESLPGSRTLFVGRIDPASSAWGEVFLAERLDPTADRITVAAEGRVRKEAANGRIWLDLRKTATYEIDLDHPDRAQVTLNAEQSLFLSEGARALSDPRQKRRFGLRTMTIAELRETIATEGSASRRREAEVELQKKWSIPFAALAFLVVGVPLGLTNRRGGKGSAFAISVALVALYYILLNATVTWGIAGSIPAPLSPWIPNLVMLGFGAFFLLRVEKDLPSIPDLGLFYRLGELFGWLRRGFRKTTAEPGGDLPSTGSGGRKGKTGESGARSPEGGGGSAALAGQEGPVAQEGQKGEWSLFRFPILLDRLVAAQLARVLLLVVSSVLMIFLIVDYTQIFDSILKYHVSAGVVAAYYEVLTLQILHDTIPFSFLIATLVTFGMLERRSELTAAKASGISVYRLAFPVLLLAGCLGILAFYYQESILPTAGPEISRLRARIRGKELSLDSASTRWFASEDGSTLLAFRMIDRRSRTLVGLSGFRFGEDGGLVLRFESARAMRTPKGWILLDGWERRYAGGLEVEGSYRKFHEPIAAPFEESLEAIASVSSDDLSLSELARRLEKLETSGYDVVPMRFQFHFRLTAPFAALVLGLLGVPLAVRFGRRGTMAGIGLGFGIGMTFLVLLAFFSKMGEAGQLPPALAAWSPYVFFGLGGIWSILGTET